MWSGIGNTIAQVPGQIQDAQSRQRRAELENMHLAEAKQLQAGQGVVDRAMQGGVPSGPQEQGAPPADVQQPYLTADHRWDVPKLAEVLSARGMGHLAPQLLESAEKMNASFDAHDAAQQKLADANTVLWGRLAGGYQAAKKAGVPDEQAFDLIVEPAVRGGKLTAQQAQQTKAQLMALPPEQRDAQINGMIDQADKVAPTKTLAEGAKEIGMSGRVLAENAPKPKAVEKATFGLVQPDGTVKDVEGTFNPNGNSGKGTYEYLGKDVSDHIIKSTPQESAQTVDKLLDGKPATLMFDPKTKKYTDASGTVIENAATRIKPIPSASAISINAHTLSAAALDQAAQKYLESGSLPPGMGMGPQRTAIMNRAAELDPSAALARNAAVYKADQANLTKLQTTEGTLSAFENTAGKNLNQFLATAAKIPDVGVPWINAPLRTVDAKLLGSTDQAAFNAARDVALREIARVTNDPKLSGALTDSARAEVAGLSPANATFAQIKRVAEVLKQDMANVHSGLREQIATVKAGIGGGTPTQGGGDKEGDTKPIPGFPGTEQTFKNGKWIRTK